MLCPDCSGETSVENTRPGRTYVHRYRRCKDPGCGTVFSTIEVPNTETRARAVETVRERVLQAIDKYMTEVNPEPYRAKGTTKNKDLKDARTD